MRSIEGESCWEISNTGQCVATRDFLTRRGYCCAKRCQNCPYINWYQQTQWQPVDPENVRRMRVSSRAVAGAQALLHYHEQQLQTSPRRDRIRHRRMIDHYSLLLARWGIKKAAGD